MNQNDVKNIFNSFFNGEKNFMTPDVFKFDMEFLNAGNMLLIELSEEGLRDQELKGITILFYNVKTGTASRTNLSRCITGTRSDARKEVKNILKEYIKNPQVLKLEGGFKKVYY